MWGTRGRAAKLPPTRNCRTRMRNASFVRAWARRQYLQCRYLQTTRPANRRSRMSCFVTGSAKPTRPYQRLSSAEPPEPAAAPEPDMPLVPAPPLIEPLPAGALESGPPVWSGRCGERVPEVMSGGLDGGPGGACAGALPPAVPVLLPLPMPAPELLLGAVVAAPEPAPVLGPAVAPFVVPALTEGPVFGVGDSRASHAVKAAAIIIVAPTARQPLGAAVPGECNTCLGTAWRCRDAGCAPRCVGLSWLDLPSVDVLVM